MYPDSYHGTIKLYSTDNQEQSSPGSIRYVPPCFPMDPSVFVLVSNTYIFIGDIKKLGQLHIKSLRILHDVICIKGVSHINYMYLLSV